MKFNCDSINEIIRAAAVENCKISELILNGQAEEMELSKEALYRRMEAQYNIMCESVEEGLKANVRSNSGLTGGDAYLLKKQLEKGTSLIGGFFTESLMRASAVSEVNAAMGRIVASPTAGSCGIVPGAIITMQKQRGCSKEECVMSLFTASGVGMVIAKKASLSGAEGGCQAECGSASAMAAAALVELAGGTPEQCGQAVAIAIKNILGLVCDPVAGLVEIPCIKRNAGGVTNALTAAELALAGIKSAIPADEVIVSMKQVGDSMCSALKETAEGGLAATPTGRELCRKIFS